MNTPDVTGRTIKFLRGEIIEIRYAGQVRYSDRIEVLALLERMQPNDGVCRLLINYTSTWPGPYPEPAAAKLNAKELERAAFASGAARVALLNAPAELRAWMTTATGQGAFQLKEFQDRELAIKWLGEASRAS